MLRAAMELDVVQINSVVAPMSATDPTPTWAADFAYYNGGN
jgi:hypothetical protein